MAGLVGIEGVSASLLECCANLVANGTNVHWYMWGREGTTHEAG